MRQSSTCSRRLRPRAQSSRWRRNRSRVSHLSHLSPAGLIHLGSAPNLIRVLVFRSADGSRELNNLGTGHTDSLQLFSAGAGGAADRGPRGMPGD
jgi:hypothetical protein